MKYLPSVVPPLLACVYAQKYLHVCVSVCEHECVHLITALHVVKCGGSHKSSAHPVLSQLEVKEDSGVKAGHICLTVCPLL